MNPPNVARNLHRFGMNVIAILTAGGLQGGVPTDFYVSLARSAAAGGTRVILDTSVLTKLNFGEFVELGYSGPREHASILAAMAQIIGQRLTENLIVTLDADGALLASGAGERLPALPPETRVVSHVGAGVSFVPVLVHQLVVRLIPPHS